MRVWGGVYYSSFCRLAQQPSKGDDGGHAGTVEEEEGGHALQAACVGVVRQVVWRLALDVQQEAAEPPGDTQERILVFALCDVTKGADLPLIHPKDQRQYPHPFVGSIPKMFFCPFKRVGGRTLAGS